MSSNAGKAFLRQVKAALWDQGRAKSTGNMAKFPGVYWVAPDGRTCGVGCSHLGSHRGVYRITLIHCAGSGRFSEWTATVSEVSGLASKAFESAENGTGLQRHSPGALMRKKVQFVWEEACEDDSHCTYFVTRKSAQALGFTILADRK